MARFGTSARCAGPDFSPRRHLWSGPERGREPSGGDRATHREAGPGLQPHPCRRYCRCGMAGIARPDVGPLSTSRTTSRLLRRTSSPTPPGSWAIDPPPEISFDDADLSPMGRSFYGENKRVSNRRLREALGYGLRYPTYREGIRRVCPSERAGSLKKWLGLTEYDWVEPGRPGRSAAERPMRSTLLADRRPVCHRARGCQTISDNLATGSIGESSTTVAPRPSRLAQGRPGVGYRSTTRTPTMPAPPPPMAARFASSASARRPSRCCRPRRSKNPQQPAAARRIWAGAR